MEQLPIRSIVLTREDLYERVWSMPISRLESRLNEFIASLLETADFLKARRRELELAQARQRAWEQERWKKLEAIGAEEARVQRLHAEARNWEMSRQIRRYVRAVRGTVTRSHGEILRDCDTDRWIRWALQQAGRLDPLRPSPPSILDEKPMYESDAGPPADWKPPTKQIEETQP